MCMGTYRLSKGLPWAAHTHVGAHKYTYRPLKVSHTVVCNYVHVLDNPYTLAIDIYGAEQL